jgi:hypothetical protein
MCQTNPTPLTSRRLVKNSEVLDVRVETIFSAHCENDLFRFSAYFHPTDTRCAADSGDALCHDETGCQGQVRLSFVNFLLRKRQQGWHRIDTRTEPEATFWRTDNNL